MPQSEAPRARELLEELRASGRVIAARKSLAAAPDACLRCRQPLPPGIECCDRCGFDTRRFALRTDLVPHYVGFCEREEQGAAPALLAAAARVRPDLAFDICFSMNVKRAARQSARES